MRNLVASKANKTRPKKWDEKKSSMALHKALGRPKEAVPKNFKNSFGKQKRRGIQKSRLEER